MSKLIKIKKKVVLKTVIVWVCLLGIMVSCTQEEDLTPVTIKKEEPKVPVLHSKSYVKYPTIGVYSVTPCGYGFKVQFYYLGTGGMAIGVTKPYEIYNASGVLVDSGNVTHNGNTNWVLNPCEVYTVKIDAGPFTGIVTYTVTSDGCGGLFIC